jgi:hypothetical protein
MLIDKDSYGVQALPCTGRLIAGTQRDVAIWRVHFTHPDTGGRL